MYETPNPDPPSAPTVVSMLVRVQCDGSCPCELGIPNMGVVSIAASCAAVCILSSICVCVCVYVQTCPVCSALIFEQAWA